MTVLVAHCRREPYDVYVGRGRGSIWGNPYRIGPDGDRDTVIEKYRLWLMGQSELLARARIELRDKVLGCFCRPREGFQGRLLCHAQILAGIANDIPPYMVE